MNEGRIRLIGWAVALALTLPATAGAPEVQDPTRPRVFVAPVVNTCDPRFANAIKDAVREAMSRITGEYTAAALKDAGYEGPSSGDAKKALEKLEIDFSKGGDRNLGKLVSAGAELGCGFAVLVWIHDCSQENAEQEALLSNLGARQSQSKAKVRVWIADVPGKKLILDGSKVSTEGLAKGPFFGTTRKGELSGNPQDVEFVIMEENRRRATWLGKAACVAVFEAVGPKLGLKLVPK
jgi:hypothetical protein